MLRSELRNHEFQTILMIYRDYQQFLLTVLKFVYIILEIKSLLFP